MEVLFDKLWNQADLEREKGNRQRAAALYRKAFAVIGLDLDGLRAEVEGHRRKTNTQAGNSIRKNARLFPKIASSCNGGVCGI
ncbi:MAG TPA: hypothetical protein V6D22_25525 [Candidatus Obscuribacterales bacterium]